MTHICFVVGWPVSALFDLFQLLVFFSQTMDYMFGETTVLGHCDYLVPFLFFRLFHDGHFGHSVDIKEEGR